jgi:hypothetical protein
MAFWGCAQGRQAEDGDRSGRVYAGKTLAVILPDSTLAAPRNPEDVASVFAGSPAAALAQEFGEAFWTAFSADIDFVIPLRVPDSLARPSADQRIVHSVPGSLSLPAHEYAAPSQAWLEAQGIKADLVLVIGPLASATGHDEHISPKFGGAIKVTYLAVEGWYLIWDYAAGRALAQGRFRPTVEYKRNQTPRIWAQAFAKAVDAVGEASPFKGPKWYRR